MERATLETVRQHITAEYEIVTEATARLRLPTEIKFKLCLVTIKLFSPGLPIAELEPHQVSLPTERGFPATVA